MKCGIVTLFRNNNYGAVLQAFALQKAVLGQGIDAEIINLSITSKSPVSIKRRMKMIFRNLFVRNEINEYLKAFDRFRKHHLKISSDEYTDENQLHGLKYKYDFCICGSDQVWNPDLFGRIVPAYFLDFMPYSRKVTYAPSFGTADVSATYVKETTVLLQKIPIISLRERTGVAIVKNLTGKKAKHVLDPIFLLSKNEWLSRSRIPKPDFKYLLLYMQGEKDTLLYETSHFIADKLNLKVIQLGLGLKTHKYVYRKMRNAGPFDFVGLIAQADFVCTNSFHGTAFSILFDKRFASASSVKSRSTRITDLLDSLALNERYLDGPKKTDSLLPLIEPLCSDHKGRLESQIRESKKYLSKCICKQQKISEK